jgi:LysM repeat protein
LVYLQRKKKTGKKTHHRVRKGETLVDISQKAGQLPKSGQKLLLKEPATKETIAAKNSSKSSSKKNKSVVHVVKNGESLWTIARKYNVTVSSIKSANKLKSEDLDIGQSLKILK